MNFHKIYLIKFLTFSKLTSFYDESFFIIFFMWISLRARLNSHYDECRLKLQEKEIKYDNHRGELLRKNPRKKCAYSHF